VSLPQCIVLATDLATRTDRAQDRAVGLARAWNAKLTFVSAIDVADLPNDELKESAPEIARRRTHRLLRAEVSNTRDVIPKVVIHQGNAAAVVLRTAQLEGADLIIAGTAGIDALGRLLLGGTTAELVAHASVPVLIGKKARDPALCQDPRRHRPIRCFGIRFGDRSRIVPPAQITLYHAFDMPYRGLVDDKAAYEADARTRCAKRELSLRGVWEQQPLMSRSKLVLVMQPPASLDMPHKQMPISCLRGRTDAQGCSASYLAALPRPCW
jgi:nucleotide-binding universal stress UspA family protein